MAGDNSNLLSNDKFDLSRLPPCISNLIPHIYRVNHRLAFYKRAHIPIIESPNPWDDKQGWTKGPNQVIEPIWQIGAILPSSLVDILEGVQSAEEEFTEVEQFEDYIEEEDDDSLM